MKESGWYPAGSEFDPSAPWNQVNQESKEIALTFKEEVEGQEILLLESCADNKERNKMLWDFYLKDTFEQEFGPVEVEDWDVLSCSISRHVVSVEFVVYYFPEIEDGFDAYENEF